MGEVIADVKVVQSLIDRLYADLNSDSGQGYLFGEPRQSPSGSDE